MRQAVHHFRPGGLLYDPFGRRPAQRHWLADRETGELAGAYCPQRHPEWFKPGTEPLRECTSHDEPYYDDDEQPEGERVNTDPVQDVFESIGKEAKRAWKKIFRF